MTSVNSSSNLSHYSILSPEEIDPEDLCTICYDSLSSKEAVKHGPHKVGHKDCLSAWIFNSESTNCLICQKKVNLGSLFWKERIISKLKMIEKGLSLFAKKEILEFVEETPMIFSRAVAYTAMNTLSFYILDRQPFPMNSILLSSAAIYPSGRIIDFLIKDCAINLGAWAVSKGTHNIAINTPVSEIEQKALNYFKLGLGIGTLAGTAAVTAIAMTALNHLPPLFDSSVLAYDFLFYMPLGSLSEVYSIWQVAQAKLT
jgi:hypothetical protein